MTENNVIYIGGALMHDVSDGDKVKATLAKLRQFARNCDWYMYHPQFEVEIAAAIWALEEAVDYVRK